MWVPQLRALQLPPEVPYRAEKRPRADLPRRRPVGFGERLREYGCTYHSNSRRRLSQARATTTDRNFAKKTCHVRPRTRLSQMEMAANSPLASSKLQKEY